MALGAKTSLVAVSEDVEVVAQATLGTTVYLISNKGSIHSYTISGGANAKFLVRFNEIITCMCILSGYLFIGTAYGNLYRVTISDLSTSSAVTPTLVANVNGRISSICIYAGSTLLYITVAGSVPQYISVATQ